MSSSSSSSDLITQVLRRKNLLHITAKANEGNELHRTLTATSLTLLGVGCIVGAGIFVITGQAAALAAGPALSLSFVLSAVACFFCGLCYAELSAAIPVSGSAYTFTYVAVGEYAAWFVAICLILEYLVSTATVTVGWSASVQTLLSEFDIYFPPELSRAPLQIADNGGISLSGSFVNLPAVFINAVLTVILCSGVKESTTVNNIFVAIKLSVLAVFVGFGIHFAVTNTETFTDNMTPFIPPNTDGVFGHFGISGIFRGAGMVFFSYVGFDAVCSMAQECKNPGRDLPRGLMYALVACTFLYVVATLSLTGMVKYDLLNVDDPVPRALSIVGAPPIIRYLVDIGAIAGLTSCCLVAQMCTPRLLYTLSNDGLIPKFFGKVHEKYRTPFVATICCGSLSGFISGLLPLNVLGEVVSAGTLMAFMMVCLSLIALRKTHPEFPRPFKVPFVPLFPLIGVALCLAQIVSLPMRTLIYYLVLQAIMFAVYYYYGREKSRVLIGIDDGNNVAMDAMKEKSQVNGVFGLSIDGTAHSSTLSASDIHSSTSQFLFGKNQPCYTLGETSASSNGSSPMTLIKGNDHAAAPPKFSRDEMSLSVDGDTPAEVIITTAPTQTTTPHIPSTINNTTAAVVISVVDSNITKSANVQPQSQHHEQNNLVETNANIDRPQSQVVEIEAPRHSDAKSNEDIAPSTTAN